ncbi:hypothetical protein [Streptomyces sp. MAR4 CNX-425]|uniref:hypothetical protein n=1 Tax=Streptomyces sp. MAR4 CNX-425 TaxID=3406343 RepID=UPI003B51505F
MLLFVRMRESRVRGALARARRREGEGDHREALRDYRAALRQHRRLLDRGHLLTGVDVRVTATAGIHRALRELHRHAPAETRAGLTAELAAARAAALRAVLGRARGHRERGLLADAQRDFRTVVDDGEGNGDGAGGLPGEAARELAEMIDDARGNPRHDRYPDTPYDRDQPRPVRTPAPGSRARLRALGYATEADARAAAVRLCRTALAHPTPVFERHGVSALLAQLLEDDGDAEGAAAARAHGRIPLLLDGALTDAGHSHAHSRAQEFAPYVIARLRPAETVEHLRWSTLTLPHPPGSYRTGYLLRTGERLLFLEDFFYPHLRGDDGRPPPYEALAVERAHVRGTFATDERGGVRWHLTFGPRADGAMAHQGEVFVALGKDPGPWRNAAGAPG